MPSRSLLVAAILILAVSLPFLIGKSESSGTSRDSSYDRPAETKLAALWRRVNGSEGSTSSDQSQHAQLQHAQEVLAENNQLLAGQPVNLVALAGVPGVTIPDALRFDVTPAWVGSTWPRVTPQTLETGWYGSRVPLVTGTAAEDIAGSLTYYFNVENYVERITLYGTTGDAEPLISFVQQKYNLRPVTAVGRGLFVSSYNNVPIGYLRVEDAPVQSNDQIRKRFHIKLELNLPRPGAMLSPEVMEKLRKLRDAKLI